VREILFRPDDSTDTAIDVARLPSGKLRRVRRHMQMIFQDPYSSLNPRMARQLTLRRVE
jgi:ABC-type microcin C transport system duplicated ATPase subunit YejF